MHARVIIADQDPAARKALRSNLANVSWVTVIHEAGDSHTAVLAIDHHRPDLVFLDLPLPEAGGLDVLPAVRHRPAVIVTTTCERYAVLAFEVQAVDFLLKPVVPARLQSALARAQRLLAEGHGGRGYVTPIGGFPKGLRPTQLFLRDGARTLALPLAAISHCEARGDYVAIHAEGRRHLVHQPLGDLERRLDATRFVRVHRSYIVNLHYVAEVSSLASGRLAVTLRDGTQLRASRTRAGTLRRLMA